MKLRLLAVLIAGIVAGGLAFAQKAEDGKKGAKKSEGKAVTVRLAQQNKSGESGTARLTPQGDKTKVDINLKGAPKGVSQPVHVHDGSCAKLDPKPKYGLQNVVDGKSTSEVPVKLDELTGGNLAINVHKSAEEVKTYVACGDIKKPRAAKKSSEKKS
jgi:hypothetical protein